jgi:hypothetical protein
VSKHGRRRREREMEREKARDEAGIQIPKRFRSKPKKKKHGRNK